MSDGKVEININHMDKNYQPLDMVLFLSPQTALADEGVSLETAVSAHTPWFVSPCGPSNSSLCFLYFIKCPLAQSKCVCEKGERGHSGPPVSIPPTYPALACKALKVFDIKLTFKVYKYELNN